MARPTDDTSPERPGGRTWNRSLRLSRGNVLVGVLTLLLGLALVAQVRTTQEADLSQLREADLIALLDDVTTRADSLEDEIVQLEQDRDQLANGSGDDAAREAAQARLQSYQVLAGTVPVQGPGVTILVEDPDRTVTATMMVDLVQELRDAGAEAIQVGEVRVVASSWVGITPDGQLTVEGVPLTSPYLVTAIGDSHTLAGAMNIPGGFNDSVRRVGGDVTVLDSATLTIDALHEPDEPRYAQPIPSEEP
ncbi:DUF881 domain-containing protein [Ornithinicoccus hortensis]|uniref:Uncharacterized protein YlxW (UPF0749 family) n=1 Tax=Ornithinicoccus hortensis TaxID=82346 RepID=A0A542YTJ7_9MICO|nr:DUF881 domain-containing protein [Ornithinicoccus hortensis]TQL51274.1 uncharacterized protein YlxW (UPF0749 family) [Ornithinicoccus hortensis]